MLRGLFRQAGFGRAAYQLLYRPLGLLRQSMREGGPLEQRRTERGRAEMEMAAESLSPLLPGTGKPLEVHVLTGRRFWYQTAFCLWTFGRSSRRPISPFLYDDGTLTNELRSRLAHVFPAARFAMQEETVRRLDSALPAGRFPVLRSLWLRYPNIRKLTDVHAGASGWRLVLDSDMLFFREPEFLLSWLDTPTRPLHAVDVETAYGYSSSLLRSLAAKPLAERLNVGLCGLRSEDIDWDQIERCCANLTQSEGLHYYLEQALVALLLAGKDCAIAPELDYVTMPALPEAARCTAVMHHYVAESKRWYFQSNWRKVLGTKGKEATG